MGLQSLSVPSTHPSSRPLGARRPELISLQITWSTGSSQPAGCCGGGAARGTHTSCSLTDSHTGSTEERRQNEASLTITQTLEVGLELWKDRCSSQFLPVHKPTCAGHSGATSTSRELLVIKADAACPDENTNPAAAEPVPNACDVIGRRDAHRPLPLARGGCQSAERRSGRIRLHLPELIVPLDQEARDSCACVCGRSAVPLARAPVLELLRARQEESARGQLLSPVPRRSRWLLRWIRGNRAAL
ncbi:unnamed protein product [Pleuronectes platessa]|uniref:Uncharacterized protein n=1 Tax=Pleuronectes platessa TaxID=8262 RepID=A0A9N7V5A0_PLEPL|nr:unnamed protein product [Pleuronectes platessa]